LVVKNSVPEGPGDLLLRPRPATPPLEFPNLFKRRAHPVNVDGLLKPRNHGDGGYFHVRGATPRVELVSEFIQGEDVREMIVRDGRVPHFKDFPNNRRA
jgi:hypothetical protein